MTRVAGEKSTGDWRDGIRGGVGLGGGHLKNKGQVHLQRIYTVDGREVVKENF